MGPVAFVIVFMLIPLAAAVFAAGFFAAKGVFNVLSAIPTSAWAALTVGAGVVVAARLWVVVRALNGDGQAWGRSPTFWRSPGSPGGAAKPPERTLGGGAS